jgi:hypothetical protein
MFYEYTASLYLSFITDMSLDCMNSSRADSRVNCLKTSDVSETHSVSILRESDLFYHTKSVVYVLRLGTSSELRTNRNSVVYILRLGTSSELRTSRNSVVYILRLGTSSDMRTNRNSVVYILLLGTSSELRTNRNSVVYMLQLGTSSELRANRNSTTLNRSPAIVYISDGFIVMKQITFPEDGDWVCLWNVGGF